MVESSLSELTSDVQRSLGFYKSKNTEANFECIVVSGNTFRLPGLTQFIADRLGYGIIELIELEQIDINEGLDRAHFLDDLQSLGVAMGLGLQGIGWARQMSIYCHLTCACGRYCAKNAGQWWHC